MNVIDLVTLFAPSTPPHGLTDGRFAELFTSDRPVVFAFHGYQYAVHQLVQRRPKPARFDVRGFNERGTTTTPFDMVVLNHMSRIHLAELALRFSGLLRARVLTLQEAPRACIDEVVRYTRERFEDPPEISDWSWAGPRPARSCGRDAVIATT